MTTAPNPYRGFRFPAEVIEHAVWLYHCFSLSLRDVETILAARGIVVSHESIRDWGLRFGLYRIPLNRCRKKRLAAVAFRRSWTRMSSTTPCWSTARQR